MSARTLRRLEALAAVGVVAGVPAYVLGVYLPSFNTRHVALEAIAPALASADRAAANAGARRATPALARRLAVFVVDGVSFDAFLGLDELLSLRHEGALRGTRVPFPSFTSPAITSFTTGLDPIDSGVRLNGPIANLLPLDSVTARAEEAGAEVRVYPRGWKPYEELVRAERPTIVRGKLAFAASMWARRFTHLPAVPLPADDGPCRELTWTYVGEADAAAHRYGAASAEYTEAEHRAASLVARFAETLDLRTDTLVVVSDHGHLATGGHGGIEPEVLRGVFFAVGSFVRKGVVLPDRPTRDVASTIALLAGVRAPSQNLGRPMLDALDIDDEQHAYGLAGPFEEATRTACALLPTRGCADAAALAARLRRADGTAWSDAEALLDAMTDERWGAIEAAAERRAAARLGIATAIAAVLVAFGTARLGPANVRASRPARGALVAIASVLGYAALLGALGYRISFSKMTAQEIFIRNGSCAALVELAIALSLGRRIASAPGALLATAIPFALLAAWVGADPKSLPPPHAGAIVFLAAPAVVAAAIAALVLGVIARRRVN